MKDAKLNACMYVCIYECMCVCEILHEPCGVSAAWLSNFCPVDWLCECVRQGVPGRALIITECDRSVLTER